MPKRHRDIIRKWTWAATVVGVTLGPGVDAAALLSIWVGGYMNLANSSDVEIDKEWAKGFVGAIFGGFVQWYVSGKIAQIIVASLGAAGLTLTTATGGLGILLAGVMYLGSNALINALFTFRFLSAADALLSDASVAGGTIVDGAGTIILQQLMDVTHLGDDFVKMFRNLF
jgi:uncharacterized protein (DUF697 family)